MAAYDIVLYGATGFVGQLVADYLALHPEGDRFSWAIAGRNPEKLERVKESISGSGVEPGVIVAQAADSASVEAMVADASMILNVAGPFSECHGENIVAACARSGTHYADLSGEYWYQRRLIDEYHEEAGDNGATIVLAAGVDSIPSDLGVQLAIERLTEKGGEARYAKALFTSYAGSFSGGTRRSMQARKNITQSGEYEASFHTDPYVLAPGFQRSDDGETVSGWDSRRFDSDFGQLGSPFFMAPINARVVRRSLALDGHLPCSYEEGIATTALLKTAWLYLSRGFGYFVGAPIPLKPEPGEGPPDWLQRAGSFAVRLHVSTEDRQRSAMAEVCGSGDPGYLATSKMLSEVGLCLLLDDAPPRAGVLTPSTALGPILRRRLAAAEDGRFMQFSVLD